MITKQYIQSNKYYYWSTDYPLLTNADSMNDFIDNELDESINLLWKEDNQCEIKIDGKNYLINVYGDGDFCSHCAKIYEI